VHKLSLLGDCAPFIAQASGLSIPEVYALDIKRMMGLCGAHGVELLVRAKELTELGKNVELELTVAEILALQPLAELFQPALAAVA